MKSKTGGRENGMLQEWEWEGEWERLKGTRLFMAETLDKTW